MVKTFISIFQMTDGSCSTKTNMDGNLLRIQMQARADYYRNLSISAATNKDVFEDRSKKLMVVYLSLKNCGFKDSVIKELKGIVLFPELCELIDSKEHLLRFTNGVYDFKEKIFRAGRPSDYCGYSTKIEYKPYCKGMEHENDINLYLEQVFTDIEMREFAKQTLSTILDGSYRSEKFYMLNGSGSNSKSKLMELMQSILGDYYCVLPIALMTQKRAASNSAQSELERTVGRRVAVLQEPNEDKVINVGIMKEFSGNDFILARGLYKSPIQFKPQFKMFMPCNKLPKFQAMMVVHGDAFALLSFNLNFMMTRNKSNQNVIS